MSSVQTLKQNNISYKLIIMDYFLVLFIFVSTEDMLVNEDAETVYTKHVWYYYSEEKPEMDKVFPSLSTRNSTYKLPQRSKTSNMSMFLKTCKVVCDFKSWLQISGREGKVAVQTDQTLCKVLKYSKFCCNDVSSGWNVPETVVDYCLGSLNMLSDFIDYLQNEWKIGYLGIIGYRCCWSFA